MICVYFYICKFKHHKIMKIKCVKLHSLINVFIIFINNYQAFYELVVILYLVFLRVHNDLNHTKYYKINILIQYKVNIEFYSESNCLIWNLGVWTISLHFHVFKNGKIFMWNKRKRLKNNYLILLSENYKEFAYFMKHIIW